MIIPQIDQDLAVIKAIYIQHYSGYHISQADYSQFLDAMINITKLHLNVKMLRSQDDQN